MGKIGNTIIFFLGAAAGAATAWQYAKKKYGQIAQEEIDSVKEAFARRKTGAADTEKPEPVKRSTEMEESKTMPSPDCDMPYVISPDDFGEIEDYERISLVYYSDGILTDENNVPVDDVENTVGRDSLTHFGEFEDDSVFVRNDRMKCDYEILKDYMDYSDTIRTKPRRKETR